MRRAITTMILALALAVPGLAPAQEQSRPPLTNMSEAERAELRTEIRAYLLENPEVLFEAIQILEARRAVDKTQADAALISRNSEALLNDGKSWVGGNPEGDITLVEFADYRCGYCKRAHPEIKVLLESDPNLRLVVKEFPILGPDSIAAARVALAALKRDPSRFEALNDALMRFEGNLSEPVSYQIAANAGYDIAELKEIAGSVEIEDQIAENYALGRDMGLEGTPSFIIGNRIIRGYLPISAMRQAVAEARATIN